MSWIQVEFQYIDSLPVFQFDGSGLFIWTGLDENNNDLYIGRSLCNGIESPGALVPMEGCLYNQCYGNNSCVSLNGLNFEALVYNSD